MALRAKRPCLVASCAHYASNKGYCDSHQSKVQAADAARGNSHQRGYDHHWRKARLEHLDAEPLCCHCTKRGYVVPADVVDHIQPHKGNSLLFWDRRNWQSLCNSCHSYKTATEDRGTWNPSNIPKTISKDSAENIFTVD